MIWCVVVLVVVVGGSLVVVVRVVVMVVLGSGLYPWHESGWVAWSLWHGLEVWVGVWVLSYWGGAGCSFVALVGCPGCAPPFMAVGAEWSGSPVISRVDWWVVGGWSAIGSDPMGCNAHPYWLWCGCHVLCCGAPACHCQW